MKALAQGDSATKSQSGTGSQASLSTEAPHATAQESLLVPSVQVGRQGGSFRQDGRLVLSERRDRFHPAQHVPFK